eukprot:5383800-Lingulodinium_polyedra.AAC.1
MCAYCRPSFRHYLVDRFARLNRPAEVRRAICQGGPRTVRQARPSDVRVPKNARISACVPPVVDGAA